MMSPEDQIAAIAEVRANYSHIMEALRDVKGRLEALPTHADLKQYATQAEVQLLRDQIEHLKSGSPASIGTTLVKVAIGCAAVFGLLQLLWKIPH